MIIERVATSYSLELSKEELINIMEKDSMTLDPLYDQLQRLGLEEVEYNPFFGPYIYYQVRVELDTPETERNLRQMITAYITS